MDVGIIAFFKRAFGDHMSPSEGAEKEKADRRERIAEAKKRTEAANALYEAAKK